MNTKAKNTGTNIQLVSCNHIQIDNVGSSEKENFKKDDKRNKQTLEIYNYCHLTSIVIIHELFYFLFFRQSQMKSI